MRVIVIEDETRVAQNLVDLLHQINPGIQVLVVLESIKEGVQWIKSNKPPDLAFFDIKIADGESFEILEYTDFNFPLIFTTAYDHYALKAFQYSSIDYLLKPINKEALQKALEKYLTFCVGDQAIVENNTRLLQSISELRKIQHNRPYARSLLVHFRDQLIPIEMKSIALFHLENQKVYAVLKNQETYRVSYSLEQLFHKLDPREFFRVNRQVIVSRDSIDTLKLLHNRKLELVFRFPFVKKVTVGKLKSAKIKEWLKS
jgi:DNA-binding LytR/AlgR family response regulator